MFSRKKYLNPFVLVVAIFGLGLLLWPESARADALSSAAGFLFNLAAEGILAIINQVGKLLLILVDLLIKVGSYNDFVDAQSVVIGWKVVRDVCNIGFIIGLLAIAFGTVLRIQSYHYKSTLIKLLTMAILINFSK